MIHTHSMNDEINNKSQEINDVGDSYNDERGQIQ
jgi:hypothetical protein